MKNEKQISNQPMLSRIRIDRIREQGYVCQTDSEIGELAFGNRFAYRLCVTLLIFGVGFASIPLLSVMLVIAFSSLLLPNHPFDYIYNEVLSKRMNKPKVPPRSNQLKFACTLATLWIASTIYLFYSGLTLWGYIIGSLLIVVATLVSTIDFCIPSKIYNALFVRKPKTSVSNG